MMERNKGRILVLPSWYPPDGGYFFKEHSEALHGEGWEVHVLVNRVVGARKLVRTGFKALKRFRGRNENGLKVFRSFYLKVPGNERLNIRRWAKRTLRMYRKYERSERSPGLILVHSITWAGYAAALIRETCGIPYVIVEHRSFFVWSTEQARAMVKPYHLPFFEKGYRDCSALVPVSGSLLNGLKALFPWIGEKVTIIPNMIREDMFLPPEGERGTDPFVFLWAGRLAHVKGLDILLEAFRTLGEGTDRRIRIRLAGKGELRESLEQRAGQLGIAGEVDFLGRLSREDMQREMQEANCFVLPSRYEAFGAVLIEAMSSGLPVIATRSGGPDTIVTPENGILVDPEDKDQLVRAMREMINSYERFSQVRIRELTLSVYGQKKVMARYSKIFRQVLDG